MDLKPLDNYRPTSNISKTSKIFGIDGLVLNWISSYLSNRTQIVQLGNPSHLYIRAPLVYLMVSCSGNSYLSYSFHQYLPYLPSIRCQNNNMLIIVNFSMLYLASTQTPPMPQSNRLFCLSTFGSQITILT